MSVPQAAVSLPGIANACQSAVLIAWSGCRMTDGSSVTECRTIRERELADTNEWFKPDTAAVPSASDKAAENCLSGKL